jgi:hypothetical protein
MLADAYHHLDLDDPDGHLLTATARYPIDAVVEAIVLSDNYSPPPSPSTKHGRAPTHSPILLMHDICSASPKTSLTNEKNGNSL